MGDLLNENGRCDFDNAHAGTDDGTTWKTNQLILRKDSTYSPVIHMPALMAKVLTRLPTMMITLAMPIHQRRPKRVEITSPKKEVTIEGRKNEAEYRPSRLPVG